MSNEEVARSGFGNFLRTARNGIEDVLAATGIFLAGKHLLDGLRGKAVPLDSPSKLAVSIGGHRSPDDEKWHELARKKMNADKRLLWDEFLLSTGSLYGEGNFSRNGEKHFLSDLRVMLAAMMANEQATPVKKTEFKNDKGVVTRVVTENDPTFTPLAVWVMEESADMFGAEKARLTSSGETEEDARAAARDKLLKSFQSRGLPTPSFVNGFKAIDDAIQGVPVLAAKIGTIVKDAAVKAAGVAGTTYEGVGTWIDQKHDELEERNNRTGVWASICRWYDSLL